MQSREGTDDESYGEISELFQWIDKNNDRIPELRSSQSNTEFEPGS